MKNNNFKKQLICYLVALTGLWTTTLMAQQPSGSHVSSYNFTQSNPGFFEQNGVVAPFKTTLATGIGVFTSTSNAFLLPTGFSYTINGTTYVGTGAGFTGNAFLINSNGWIGFNNNGVVNSITSPAATTTTPLTVTTSLPTTTGAASSATAQGNGAVFSAMGRALVGNAAGANGIANGSECYVVTYGDGRIVVEWRNMKPSSLVTGRIDYEFIVYPDNYLGGGLKASVEYRYANCSYTGTASTAQVGMRGWQSFADDHMRVSAADWSATTLGAPSSSTGTTVALSATIFPATGLSYKFTPCTVAPAFAALPYCQGFESTWLSSGCGSGITQDIPDNSWRSGPLFGETSWRRQDAGATAFWSNLTFGVPPAGFTGTGCAVFHTYAGTTSNSGQIGVMDLFVNVATGVATLNFNHVNTSGSDVLRVRVSTDGGVTFPTLAATIGLNAVWTAVTPISISGSPTTVIRFEAAGDFGTTDIAVDNICLTPVVTPPNCATTFFPVNGATSVCRNLTLTWASGGGGPSGYKLTFGTNSPNYDNIVNNVNLGNVLSYNAGTLAASTTYGWRIVPTNVNGDAVGCTFNTFTTGTVVCYCSTSYANGTGSGDYISQVTVPPTTLNNLTVGAGTPYYTLYPQSGSTTGTFAQSSAYVMTVKGGTYATCFIRGWIDYNQDGNFTAGETIGISPNVGASTTGTISFTIPGGAALGTARLRLRSSDTSPGSGTGDFCNATNSGYGETEDYDITIITPPAPSVSTFNPPAACGASTIIITGSDFTGTTAVTFGGTPAQSFVVNNANQITAVVSNSGSTGVISVTSPNGTGSSGGSFTFNGVGPVVSIQEGASFTKCAGQSQTLTALPTGGGETYAWSTSETTQAISVSSAGSYTVTVTNTGGCTNTTSAALTIIALPSGVTANASTSSVCDGTPFNLTSTGTTTGTGTILSEGFESGAPGWSFQDSSSTGAAIAQQTWHIQTAPYTDPTGSITFSNFSVTGTKFAYTNADAGGSGSQTRTFMTSPSFSTAAFSGNGTLTFKMLYEFWSSSSPAEQVIVQISIDGGATWAANLANYSPTNTGPNVGTVTNNAEVAVPVTVSVPAIYMGYSNVKLRWRYLSNWGYVWIVDDVLLTATPLPSFSWTSSPAGFTSGVQNPTGVTQSVNRTYTVVATGEGGCTASATTATVNTLARPTGSLSGTTALCNGQSTTLTVTVTGLGGINGTINPGSIPFSGTAPTITVNVSPTSTTTYSINTMSDANCTSTAGDLTGSAVITVNPLPTPSISGTLAFCSGGSTILDAGAYAGYSWSTGATTQTISVSSANTFTVTVTDGNGCSGSDSKTTTVYANPTPSITGTLAFCSGGSTLLDAGAYAGYSWSTGATTQTISVSSANTFTVTVTDGNGCSGSDSKTTTVYTNPTPSITGTLAFCSGGSTLLDAGAYAGYSWSTGATTQSISVSSANTFTVTVTDGNGCTGNDSKTTTVNARPTGVLSGTQSICPGGTATLSIAATGSGTISGTLSPGAIPYSGTAPTITVNVSPAVMTSYSINTMTDANCTSDPGDLSGGATVSVYTTATAPTSVTSDDANNEICAGQQIMLTANGGAFGNAPGSTYKWYEGGCGTGPALGSSSTLSVTPTAGTHTYYVRIEDACGNSSCASLVVLVSSGPPSNSVGTPVTPSEACNGTVSLVSVNSVGGPNVKYSWNTGSNSSVVLFSTNIGGPFSPGPFLTTTNSVYAQFGALAGSSGYNICVQGVNACGSTNNKCDWIRGVVSVPGTITPPAGVVACANDVKNYSCGASGGATVYNWTLGGSATPITSGQGTTNVSVTFPPAFTSAQLCVTAALSCGGSSTSAPRCMTVSKTPATPGAFTAGPSAVCPGATGVTFTIPAVTGASGYTWTTPAGTTIAGGQNSTSITVNFPNPYTGAPPVCVTANSACASSVARCKTVGSNLPGQPGTMSGPTTNVCNSTVQYSISNVANATNYTWTNPAGTTITSGQTTTTILLSVSPSFVSGQLTVVANTNACTPGTSVPRTITINGKPNVPATITASPPVWCTGGFVNFSVTPVSPLPTYNWTVSNGTITAGQGSNNIDVTWGATTAGTVNVNASNGCGASSNRSQSFSAGCREESSGYAKDDLYSVYPNPAHDKVTVSVDVKESTTLSLQLMDVSGRVVLSENFAGTAGVNMYDLDLTALSKGVYMLEVKSAQNNWKTKVAVE